MELAAETEILRPALALAINMTWYSYTIDAWKKSNSAEFFFAELKENENRLKGQMLFIRIEASRLSFLIPEDIIRNILERLEKCWERYSNILKDDKNYLPEEIDNATDAVIACICRELQRFYKLNKSIPAGILREYWEKYACLSGETE